MPQRSYPARASQHAVASYRRSRRGSVCAGTHCAQLRLRTARQMGARHRSDCDRGVTGARICREQSRAASLRRALSRPRLKKPDRAAPGADALRGSGPSVRSNRLAHQSCLAAQAAARLVVAGCVDVDLRRRRAANAIAKPVDVDAQCVSDVSNWTDVVLCTRWSCRSCLPGTERIPRRPGVRAPRQRSHRHPLDLHRRSHGPGCAPAWQAEGQLDTGCTWCWRRIRVADEVASRIVGLCQSGS